MHGDYTATIYRSVYPVHERPLYTATIHG